MPESLDRDAAKDHKESLAMNAKCEADVFAEKDYKVTVGER